MLFVNSFKMETKAKSLKEELKEYDNMSNNEILFRIKQLEADHDAIKLKMLSDFDKMEAIETKFARASQILKERLETK